MDGARAIIAQHRAEEWKAAISDAVHEDPGAALHEIEKGLDDPDPAAAAKALMLEYAATFAAHAGRSVSEFLAEERFSLEERLPAPAQGRVTAELIESCGDISLVIWAGGEVHTIAIFPAQRSVVASAWRSAVVQNVAQFTNAKTLADVAAEPL